MHQECMCLHMKRGGGQGLRTSGSNISHELDGHQDAAYVLRGGLASSAHVDGLLGDEGGAQTGSGVVNLRMIC